MFLFQLSSDQSTQTDPEPDFDIDDRFSDLEDDDQFEIGGLEGAEREDDRVPPDNESETGQADGAAEEDERENEDEETAEGRKEGETRAAEDTPPQDLRRPIMWVFQNFV